MCKGLITKIILILLALTMSVSPFLYSNNVYADETLIDWDTFGVDINQIGAYSYWYNNGLSNVSYQEQQSTGFVITTTNGSHDFNIVRETSLGMETGILWVYRYDNNKMGRYKGTYFNDYTQVVIQYIPVNSSSISSCTECYVGFEINENEITKLTEAQYSSITSGNNTYVNRYQQVIPSLKGTYNHSTNYNNRFKGIAYPNRAFTISFMNNINLNYITPTVRLVSDRDISNLSVRQVDQTNLGNWDLRTFEVMNNGTTTLPFDWYIPQFLNKKVDIIPIYVGNKEAMTPSLFELAYGEKYIYETHDNELIELTDTRTQSIIDLISSGNNASQQSVTIADNTNNSLITSDNAYTTLESQFSSDLTTNLNNIDLSLNLNKNNGFHSGALFIKNQFDWITGNIAPLNLIITFGLIIGLSTLLIGKVFK